MLRFCFSKLNPDMILMLEYLNGWSGHIPRRGRPARWQRGPGAAPVAARRRSRVGGRSTPPRRRGPRRGAAFTPASALPFAERKRIIGAFYVIYTCGF